MFNKIQINNNYLLIAVTACFLFVSYELSFKNTLIAWQHNKELKTQLAESFDLSSQPEYLERKNHNLDKLIALYKVDTIALRNNLISVVSILADKENVKLSEVPLQDVTNINSHFIIEKLKFEGDFFSLIKLNAKLDQENGIGVIRSEHWKMTEMYNSADVSKTLILEITLECAK